MKRSIYLLLLLTNLILPGPTWSVWDKGFNFWVASNDETMPANNTYVLTTDTSPTTRNGATFQWSGGGSLDSRHRDVGNDARLESMHFIGNTGTPPGKTFILTLPATGDYDVYLAAGEASNSCHVYLRVLDNATAFITINALDTGAANSFFDAAGNIRTASNWVSTSTLGGTKVTRTFASTTLNLELGNLSSGSSCIAHLFVSQVASATQRKPAIIISKILLPSFWDLLDNLIYLDGEPYMRNGNRMFWAGILSNASIAH